SDTGQAIAYLGDYARETATALSVTIDDGAKKTEVSIDENGKLASSSARAGSGASAESDAEATDSADRADQRTDAEATASAAGTQPSAASGSSQTADPSESTEQPTPAESSDGSESSGDAAGAAEAADGSAEATADGGEGYPLGTPFSGPAAPAAPKVKKTRVRKHSKRSPRNRPQRLKKITVPGLVLIGLAILMIGAFVVPNIVPVDSSETPRTIGSEQQLNPASEPYVLRVRRSPHRPRRQLRYSADDRFRAAAQPGFGSLRRRYRRCCAGFRQLPHLGDRSAQAGLSDRLGSRRAPRLQEPTRGPRRRHRQDPLQDHDR